MGLVIVSTAMIRAEGIGKRYMIGEAQDAYGTFRDLLTNLAVKPMRWRSNRTSSRGRSEFWALRDISFEVQHGEVLGIIGRNGAGKSTLLKIISQITEPTEGRAEIYGRVGSLLEVGTGFHPELTGRENIYLNGAILGMTKREIVSKFEEIAAFAEIDEFLDTPVKRYSSGMYVRLAFAVAAHMEPEILIVDEVLAVGDVAFQQKCLGKMSEVAESGRTVLFVSHNMGAIQFLTDRCIVIDQGKLVAAGSPNDMVAKYLDTAMDWKTLIYEVADSPYRTDNLSRAIELKQLELVSHADKLVPSGDGLQVDITVNGNEPVDLFRFQVSIRWLDGRPTGTGFSSTVEGIAVGEQATYRLDFPDLKLAPGRYHCNISVGQGDDTSQRVEFDEVGQVLHFEVLSPSGEGGARAEWFAEWGAIHFDSPYALRIR